MKPWKKILGQLAPTLASAVGGPAAGMAVKVLSGALLGKEDGAEADVEAALLSATPDQLLKLKEADLEFKEHMADIGLDFERLAVEDRGDARELAKANMTPQIMLSALFVVGYFTILGLFFVGQIAVASELQQPFLILLGVVTAAVPQILSFWFGSTAGSAAKTAALANIAVKP